MTMEVMIVSFHNVCIEQRTGVKAEYNCILNLARIINYGLIS